MKFNCVNIAKIPDDGSPRKLFFTKLRRDAIPRQRRHAFEIICLSSRQAYRDSMERTKNQVQRIRRSRNELKAAMLDAVSQLAKEKALAQITMAEVGQRAGIRTDVLRNNFSSIEKILSIYAASVDYWVSDIFAPGHPSDRAGEAELKQTLVNLADTLYKNPDMQSILLWELTEDNPNTRRMAASREQFYHEVIEAYSEQSRTSGLQIDTMAALMTAGIYYLILHRRRSTFWGVDFNSRSGRKRLTETIGQLTGLIFDALRERERTAEIARSLKAKGVAESIIAECTGLPARTVAEL